MEDDELIYKKLSDELTSDEALLFEHRLLVDPAFAEEYDFQRSALSALVQSEQAVMKEKLQNAYQTVQRQQRRRRWGWVAAAVVALLLLVGGAVGYYQYMMPALYEQYYALYEPYPEMRGETALDPSEADPGALRFYQQGDFRRAAEAFGTWPRSDRRDLYLGHCYWQTGQVATAQRYFAAVQGSEQSVMRQHADWYLALCQLRQGYWGNAQQMLQRIIDEEALYYKEARELLSQLRDNDYLNQMP